MQNSSPSREKRTVSAVRRSIVAALALGLSGVLGGSAFANTTVETFGPPVAASVICTSPTGCYPFSGFSTLPISDLQTNGINTALVLQGTASALAAASAGPAIMPTGNTQGLNSVAEAGSGKNQTASAVAMVAYQASAPGIFDLQFRGGAFGGNGNALGSPPIGAGIGSWLVEVVPSGSVEPLIVDSNPLIGLVGGGGFATTPLGTTPLAQVSASFQGGTITGSGNFLPPSQSLTEISNLMPLGSVFPDADFSGTIKFSSPGDAPFYLAVGAFSGGGAAAWAFADPFITPDAVNPNITITSTSGPNQFPNASLLSPSELQGLPPSVLNDLANIGVLPQTTTPEPSSLLLLCTGIAGLIGRKRLR